MYVHVYSVFDIVSGIQGVPIFSGSIIGLCNACLELKGGFCEIITLGLRVFALFKSLIYQGTAAMLKISPCVCQIYVDSRWLKGFPLQTRSTHPQD